jgi:hypothetical protein
LVTHPRSGCGRLPLPTFQCGITTSGPASAGACLGPTERHWDAYRESCLSSAQSRAPHSSAASRKQMAALCAQTYRAIASALSARHWGALSLASCNAGAPHENKNGRQAPKPTMASVNVAFLGRVERRGADKSFSLRLRASTDTPEAQFLNGQHQAATRAMTRAVRRAKPDRLSS